MLEEEVSGRKKNMTRKTGAASQRISHSAHRQFSAGIEKPEMTGPNAGPQVANAAQSESPYGIFRREKMSPIEAPPVARQGDPKNPWRKRRTRRPAKLSTSAVGTHRITKMPKDNR